MGSEIAVGYPVYASWKRPILTIHGVKQYLGEAVVQGDSMTDMRDEQRLILDPQESSFSAETNAVPSIPEEDEAAATDALPVLSSDPTAEEGVSVASSGPPSSSSSCAGGNEDPPFGKSEVGMKQSRSPDDKLSPQVAAQHVVECSTHGMEDDARSIRQSPVPIAATENNGSNPELPLEESRDSNWQQNPSESDEVEPTPAAPAIIVQTIPEDPNLTDADFPPPFLSPSTTPSPPDTSDPAALIYRNKFAPLPDPHLFIRALTRIAPSRRTTADLYDLATNTQAALKLWQDEYLQLDKHTAPLSAIPKRPATGGRLPLDPLEFEDLKEADLYDYTFDPKRVGFQDPFRQRIGRLDPGGRELRQRRARDVLDAAGASEYDDNDAGIVISGRTLRDRTAAHSAGTPDPASRSRKRANSSEPDRDRPPPKKRGRQVGARAGIDFLHPRVREMRGQSVTQSASTDDDDEGADDGSTFGGMSADGARSASRGRKGRPPGSKNVARRSDAGVKKGPRKAGLASSAAFGGADADGTSGFGQAEPGVTGTGTGALAGTGTGAAQPPKRRQRVKSEKRSTSMTEWWAKRKAKAAEEKIKELRARGVLVPTTGQDRPQSQSQSQPQSQSQSQPQSQVPSQSQSQSQATAQMWGEGEGRVGTQRQVECPMEAGFAGQGTGLRGAEMERVREFLQRGG